MALKRVARLALLTHFTQALRVTRRALAGAAGAAIPATAANAVRPPEFVTQQPGFTPTKSGLQIKDVKEGTGAAAATGDRVVYEWEGYTIGYFGRPFEKKAGLKGGDFEGEKDYSRFVVGRGAQIMTCTPSTRHLIDGVEHSTHWLIAHRLAAARSCPR